MIVWAIIMNLSGACPDYPVDNDSLLRTVSIPGPDIPGPDIDGRIADLIARSDEDTFTDMDRLEMDLDMKRLRNRKGPFPVIVDPCVLEYVKPIR